MDQGKRQSVGRKTVLKNGLGLQKRWGDRFTGFGQAMLRAGGRTGIGVGFGDNRAVEAARKAICTPLLEIDINGATQAIVFITSDVDISFEEVMLVMNEIRSYIISIICKFFKIKQF